jgi:DNA-binding HxlR family transcriptional regulator
MSKRLARQFAHPSELTLAILRGKWTSAILSCLEDGACRYCELRRRLPGVSDKMLTKRLQELTRSGLVVHAMNSGAADYAAYGLSPLGRSLMPVITRLSAWGREHAARYGVRFAVPLAAGSDSR